MKIVLPSYWASYIINGDVSGLEPGEKEIADRAIARECGDKWSIVSCGDEAWFTWSYRLYNPKADCAGGSVLDYVAISVSK